MGEDGCLAEAGRGVGVDWVDSLGNIDHQLICVSEMPCARWVVGFPTKVCTSCL